MRLLLATTWPTSHTLTTQTSKLPASALNDLLFFCFHDGETRATHPCSARYTRKWMDLMMDGIFLFFLLFSNIFF